MRAILIVQLGFALSLSGTAIQAQSFQVSGIVKDLAGRPVQGAVVGIEDSRFLDTTDKDGNYSIRAVVATVRRFATSGGNSLELRRKDLHITLAQPGDIRLSLFDLKGKQVYRYTQKYMLQGNYSLPLPHSSLAPQVLILSAHTGLLQNHYRLLGGSSAQGKLTFSTEHKSLTHTDHQSRQNRKRDDPIHTLSVRARGYTYELIDFSGDSAHVNVTLVHCPTRTWASWPMPNPPSSGHPNPSSYTDHGNGTVTDNITSLTWQKTNSPENHTYDNAIIYCRNLTLAGGDWRLPKRIELMSLVDYTRTSPAINRSIFPTPANFFFTSSPWILTVTDASRPRYAWVFNFYEGLTSNAGAMDALRCVRCVRGHGTEEYAAAPPPNQYKIIAPGEVRDNYTRLVWQQSDSRIKMNWEESEKYCADLTLNGHSWRIPTIKELSTLVDETKVYGALNMDMFPLTTRKEWYWSSSKWAGNVANSPGGAWGINYDDGYTGYNFTTALVRCVRCE